MHLEDSLVEVIALCSSSKMFNTLCASLLTLQTVTETWRHAQSRGGGGHLTDYHSIGGGGLGRIVTFLNASHDGNRNEFLQL